MSLDEQLERARELLAAIESEAALLERRIQDADAELMAADEDRERARLLLRRGELGWRRANLAWFVRDAERALERAYPDRQEEAA
jgi:hypothetical protein